MNSDKVSAYIGFAVKKGSVVYGFDNLEYYRKKVHVVLYTSDLSDNTLKKLQNEVTRFNCQCYVFDKLCDTLKKNCKVLAVTDKQLAVAIINNLL